MYFSAVKRMCIESPIGNIELRAKNETLISVLFTDSPISLNKDPFLQNVANVLDKYFSSGILEHSFALEPEGSDFQKQVWAELQNIPDGRTISYLDLALKCGGKTYTRAVASANGKNPISIFIPCHRVIGSDGSLTGYAGGLDRKKHLLDLESKNSQLKLF